MKRENDLIELKAQKIGDLSSDELTDITKIMLDADSAPTERVCEFLRQVQNPYLFRVEEIPVKVVFSENAPTIQESLAKLIRLSN
ncbi:MAG: hypothetical protein FWD58_05210 [Firmicutes bacterium]|nr:hypothetical protein [Bacillota bacterium]